MSQYRSKLIRRNYSIFGKNTLANSFIKTPSTESSKPPSKFSWLLQNAPKKQLNFVNHHFGTILNNIAVLTPSPTSSLRYNYHELPVKLVISIAKRTQDQQELVNMFTMLYTHDALQKDVFTAILLNKNLVSPTQINLMLCYALGVGPKSMPNQGNVLKKWSKADFISLQVALTQKFFSMRQYEHVDQLVRLNFKSLWLPYIMNQDRKISKDVLSYSIERSIWRVFFLFVKDYRELLLYLNRGVFNTSSLYLMFEAMPKNFIKRAMADGSDEKVFFRGILGHLRANKLASKMQRLFNEILGLDWVFGNPGLLEELKKVSITSLLAGNDILEHKALEDQPSPYMNVTSSLSRALFSTLSFEEKTPYPLKASQASLALDKANRIIVMELKDFVTKAQAQGVSPAESSGLQYKLDELETIAGMKMA